MDSKIKKTELEWQAELTPEQFRVARQKGTERAFTGEYNDHKADGNYTCVCCGETLFKSKSKFDSGTGWPSFYEPATAVSVEKQADYAHGMVRTEVHCRTCDAHLGHLFPDGPQPTGQRYCINSVSLAFKEVEK